MNLIEVGDKIRIFNEQEIMAYEEAGGCNAYGLGQIERAWDLVCEVETVAEDGCLRTVGGVYVSPEIAELL